jgi:hypothetical protein
MRKNRTEQNRTEEWLKEGKLRCDGWSFIEEKGARKSDILGKRKRGKGEKMENEQTLCLFVITTFIFLLCLC